MNSSKRTMRRCAPALAFVAILCGSSIARSAQRAEWPRGSPVRFVDLGYPAEALSAGVTGRVVVSVTTDDVGDVLRAEVLSGPAELAPSVLANVKQWNLGRGARSGAIVYLFEIDPGICQDDSKSLFRVAAPNLAVITACTRPGRPSISAPNAEMLEFVSFGKRPAYPPIARSASLTGVVVLEITLGDGGSVMPRPITDLPMLTETAMAHARLWRVRPGPLRRAIVVYQFALNNHACDGQGTAFWQVAPGFVQLSGCSLVAEFGS